MSTCRISKSTVQAGCSIVPAMPEPRRLPEYDPVLVGERILRLQIAKGLDQIGLAGLVDISPQKLNNYIKGRDLIPVPIGARLCTVTGANFDYLYRGLMGSLPGDLAAKLAEVDLSRPAKRAKRA
jgi:transcriptional regulator with XRE-family HTH domain